MRSLRVERDLTIVRRVGEQWERWDISMNSDIAYTMGIHSSLIADQMMNFQRRYFKLSLSPLLQVDPLLIYIEASGFSRTFYINELT